MTRIKLCGLSRVCDIEAVNELMPEYIGFVFWSRSKRYVSPDAARALRNILLPEIHAVGVFVNEPHENIARLLDSGIIDTVQLHGQEDEEYISRLRRITDATIIQAFRISGIEDIRRAEASTADYVLLDNGTGTGRVFDWSLAGKISRPYFLAGGLTPDNVAEAVNRLKPYAVDVSSGIETDGNKDTQKMREFVSAVRRVNE